MARELKALNGLRFPACLIIFMAHVPDWAWPDSAAFAAIAMPFSVQAHAAMPIFFILSGVVLTHVYAQIVAPSGRRAADRTGSGIFFVSRIARLFPLHLLTLFLILPLAWQRGEVELPPLLAHLTLTQTFIPDIATFLVFNRPSWSLSTELFFALVFPFLLPPLLRLGPRAKIAVLIGVTLAPLLAAALVDVIGRGGTYALYFNPLARLADFIAGILIYALWRHYKWQLNGAAWEVAAVILFFASLFLTLDFPAPYRHCAFFVPAGVLLMIVSIDGEGPVRRFLASGPMRYLGRLAFAFYIIQYVVISYAGETAMARLDAADPLRWFLLPALLAASFMAALALHYGFELPTHKPLRARLERVFGLLSPAPRAAS